MTPKSSAQENTDPQKIERQFQEEARRLLYLKPKNQLLRMVYLQSIAVVGAVVAALGYVLFQLPFKIASGGVTGLAIILNNYLSIPQGLLVFLLTLPLIVWGFFQLGRWKFLLSTIVAVSAFSLATDIFILILPKLLTPYPITDNELLASIYAGILFGAGMGLVYRSGGTMGGSSVPARILHKKTGFPMSQSFMIVDVSIILLAGLVFRWELALLAFLTMVLYGIVSDIVLEGSSQVRTAVIISRKAHILRCGLMQSLGRSVSILPVTGGYSGDEKTMIYCTLSRSQVADLRFAVTRIDPDAFMVLGIAQQAWGGVNFKPLSKYKS